MPSSKASNFSDCSWVTTESYPDLEATCGGEEGFAAGEETADPELLQAQLGILRLWHPNTKTLLIPFEVKMEFWVRIKGGEVGEGVRTNAWDSFMVWRRKWRSWGKLRVCCVVLYLWATKLWSGTYSESCVVPLVRTWEWEWEWDWEFHGTNLSATPGTIKICTDLQPWKLGIYPVHVFLY